MSTIAPNMPALRAVQRQTAASRSTRPLIRVQQGEDPISTVTKPPSTSTQTFNLRVSIGQVVVELTMEKKMRFRQRKRAADERVLEEAIFVHNDILDFSKFSNIPL